MALRVAAVGREPLDIAARFGLGGSAVTLENLGTSSLRYVVADAADEAAPASRIGHLLEPGERRDEQPAAGVPVWVWSNHPTRIGCGPRLGG